MEGKVIGVTGEEPPMPCGLTPPFQVVIVSLFILGKENHVITVITNQ